MCLPNIPKIQYCASVKYSVKYSITYYGISQLQLVVILNAEPRNVGMYHIDPAVNLCSFICSMAINWAVVKGLILYLNSVHGIAGSR